jgi:hemin uptake protein HemP
LRVTTDPDLSPSERALPGPVAGQDGVPCHDARALTAGGTAARIVLEGKVYDLRITRSGKLILTK